MCSNSLQQIVYLAVYSDYNINHQPLNLTDQHPYLGVIIHKSMSWVSHINAIVHKASRTLNFIKRNLYMCTKEVKETAYLILVRLCLEYASSVWDPYHLYLICMYMILTISLIIIQPLNSRTLDKVYIASY